MPVDLNLTEKADALSSIRDSVDEYNGLAAQLIRALEKARDLAEEADMARGSVGMAFTSLEEAGIKDANGERLFDEYSAGMRRQAVEALRKLDRWFGDK